VTVIFILTYDMTHFASVCAMGDLAVAYSSIGRHHDALLMKEKALEFLRLTLPEHHPHIGVTQIYLLDNATWILTISSIGGAMNNLAQAYLALGRNEDALVLFEATIELVRRVLPRDHPLIGAA
jgi:hypothetical protein